MTFYNFHFAKGDLIQLEDVEHKNENYYVSKFCQSNLHEKVPVLVINISNVRTTNGFESSYWKIDYLLDGKVNNFIVSEDMARKIKRLNL
jgi:RNA polymerase-interacting CarD/CdnL/TRCF family regulator